MTATDRGEPVGGDYLKTFDHLAVWAAAAGLIDETNASSLRRKAARDPTASESELRRALAFRDALYEFCTERTSRARAWTRVAAEAQAATARAVLVPTNVGPSGVSRPGWDWPSRSQRWPGRGPTS